MNAKPLFDLEEFVLFFVGNGADAVGSKIMRNARFKIGLALPPSLIKRAHTDTNTRYTRHSHIIKH